MISGDQCSNFLLRSHVGLKNNSEEALIAVADGGEDVWGGAGGVVGGAFPAEGVARPVLLAELGAVAEEFAAGFGGGGLFELLEEERG